MIYEDMFTGLMIDDKDEPYVPMFYVCDTFENLDEAHQEMGIGMAHALFATRAEANRYRLEKGISATTYIEVI